MPDFLELFNILLTMSTKESLGTMTVERAAAENLVPAPVTGLTETAEGTATLPRHRLGSRGQPLVVALMISVDALLALVVWLVAAVIQGAWGNGALTEVAVMSFVPALAVWVGLRALVGLYPGYGLGEAEELKRQTFALLSTLGITAVFALVSHTGGYLSRLLIFAWIVGLLFCAPIVRVFAKQWMTKAGLWGKPVVVFGAGEAGAQVLNTLRREWRLGLRPIAVFDNRPPFRSFIEGVPYGGKMSDAPVLARECGVDTAIFAMPYTRRVHLLKYVNMASLSFRRVVVIPNLAGITNSAAVAKDLSGTFGVEIEYNLLNPWAQRMKRVIDVGATLLGGIFALPLLLFLAALVWLESGGPVFYKDVRMGREERLFPCIKFRTMTPNAEEMLRRLLEENEEAREEYLKYHKLRDDPRVTRVGRFLRKTSLDELPQVWNVLRGEMSLVGPRPYLSRESEDIGDTQSEILRVTPGITGPWQVAGRNHTSFTERVYIDAAYVQDWSVWLDLVILARTFKCLLFSRDAY